MLSGLWLADRRTQLKWIKPALSDTLRATSAELRPTVSQERESYLGHSDCRRVLPLGCPVRSRTSAHGVIHTRETLDAIGALDKINN